MSSALSSLKKTKKAPLQRTTNVPFRNVSVSQSILSQVSETTEHSDASDDGQLLEEVTSNMATSRIKEKDISLRGVTPTNSTDLELMMLMTNRIRSLEVKVHVQSQQLVEKDKRINLLEERMKILKQATADEKSKWQTAVDLQNKCIELQQQVHEMETFLADYGMIWVGSKGSSDLDLDDVGTVTTRDIWEPAASIASNKFSVDYDRVVQNIYELNVLAGDGVSQVQRTIDGARLTVPNAVQLTVYLNGIFLFDGPFRPYTDRSTQDFMKDIMDGYFPSELQLRYPEGVPFKLSDKRDVSYVDKKSEIFKGPGRTLGGDERSSRLLPGATSKNLPSSKTESTRPGKRKSIEQFLNGLPQSVLKDGKLIDIRNSISNNLKGDDGSSSALTLIDTPALQELKQRLDIDESKRPLSSRHITTLRIKSEAGDHTYMLKMRFTDTIADVRKCLDQQRSSGSSKYEIISSFPTKVYTNTKATLQESGLTPNATLYMQTKKKKVPTATLR